MSVPKAKKEANAKWDKSNMLTIGCRLRVEEATAFKEYALERGTTANTILKDYVFACLDEQTRKNHITEHVKKTGESVNGFINRAIEETIERDNVENPEKR